MTLRSFCRRSNFRGDIHTQLATDNGKIPLFSVHLHPPYITVRTKTHTITIHAFFYKNILYKNIEDEMGQKVKIILRIQVDAPQNAYIIFFKYLYLLLCVFGKYTITLFLPSMFKVTANSIYYEFLW